MQLHSKYHWPIIVLAASTGLFVVIFFIVSCFQEIQQLSCSYNFYQSALARTHINPANVKGLYLTAYSAGNSKKIEEIIDLIKRTELNSVVIDIKDYSGFILYDSHLPFVNENNLKDARIHDLKLLVNTLHQNKIYTIARISTFQDPLLAQKKSEWAIKTKTGDIWRDKKGLSWVDPARHEVWDHIIAVAREAVQLGFDEINFDYIRYPTDGNLKDINYGSASTTRAQIISLFFAYTTDALKNENVTLSADLFGLTTERTGADDMNIGQRLGDAVRYFDFVCPMVYPSHYPPGYMGFKNPAEHPYEVIKNSVGSGVRRTLATHGKIRPWLQAFNVGAVYDGEKIRAQINAAQEVGASGFLLWNAANRYSADGLLPK